MGIPIPGELIFLLNQPPSHGPLILFYIYPPTHQYQYCPSLNQHSPVFQFQQCCWSHLVGWTAILCNHVGWGNQWPITQIPQSDDRWWQPAINKETTKFTRFLSSLHPLCLCHSFHADFFFFFFLRNIIYVCTFYHFLPLKWCTEDGWGPGDARSHGISSHGIDLVIMKYSSFSTRRVNSLGPGDAKRWQRYGSTLDQVMACCLTAPSHYLNQCRLISEIQWHSSEDNFTIDTSDINRMAWQWAETLVEIRGSLADIRGTTKLGCRWNFLKHEFNRPVCLEAHHYLLAHLSQ